MVAISQGDLIVRRGGLTSDLKLSKDRIGALYPVLLDKYGNIIDGQHRLKANPNWPKMTVQGIESDEDRLLARLISNVCRRTVPAGEKTEILEQLGRIYLKQGVPANDLAKTISKTTGMSYRWVMEYMPDHLKLRPGLGGPSNALNVDKCKGNFTKLKVARPATDDYHRLIRESSERVVITKYFANTNFVCIMLGKEYYLRFEKAGKKLGAELDVIINNAILFALRKIEELATHTNENPSNGENVNQA